MIERYCTKKGCHGGVLCKNEARFQGEPCIYEYVAENYPVEYRWKGANNPPASWWAGGSKVYRSYVDYCDD